MASCENRDRELPDAEPQPEAELEITEQDLRTAQSFVEAIQQATLDESRLSADMLLRLRQPAEGNIEIDPDLRLGIDLFLSSINASQDTYTSSRAGVLRRHPDDEIPTYSQLQMHITQMTGVTSMVHNMCLKSCMAFTGPFADDEACHFCNEPRYLPTGKAQREFHTIPIGPQLQALWRTAEGATNMQYRRRQTDNIRNEMAANDGCIPVYNDV